MTCGEVPYNEYNMFRTLFVGLVFSLIVLAPLDASAAIIPCGEANNPCTACDAFGLISNALSYLVGLITLVIVLVIVWAGVQIVTSKGDPGSISKAKGMLWNAIVGFAILLVAWLGVDTVIKVLTNNEATFGRPWNQIDVNQCNPPAYTVPVTPTGSSTPGGTGTTTPGVVSQGHYAHADAVAMLNGAGITVNSTIGPGGVQPSCATGAGCTTLNNIRQDVIRQTINLANAYRASCPHPNQCPVVVVGGTEPGHAGGAQSHANGYKIDIDTVNGPLGSDPLDVFIMGRLTAAGTRNGDAVYHDSCGNEYVREGTHWDITATSVCGI